MAFLLARQVFSIEKRESYNEAFSLFWFLSSGLWFFSGFRLMALSFGYGELDKIIFYGVQIFLGLHIIAGACFLSIINFTNLRIVKILMIPVSICSLLFIFFVFKDGIANTVITPWSSDHELSKSAFYLFLPAYFYCVVMTLSALVKNIVLWLLRGDLNKVDLFALIAFLIYEVAGIIDVRGRTADYGLLIVRSLYMISALVAYISYSWETSSVELISVKSKLVK